MVVECTVPLKAASLNREASDDDASELLTTTSSVDHCVGNRNSSEINVVDAMKHLGFCHHAEVKQLSLKVSDYQRELFKAISSTEKAEARRQETALELARAELLNKQFLLVIKQQNQRICETENQVKLVEQRQNQCVHEWKIAREQLEKDNALLMEKLECSTVQNEFYRASLNDLQTKLSAALTEKKTLLETVDQLTGELKSATGHREEVCALLNVKENEAHALKAEWQMLSEQNRRLEDELKINKFHLVRVQESLPVLLQVTVKQAVDRVHTVAKEQLSKTHNRMDELDRRLWQQIRRLHESESIKDQLGWFPQNSLPNNAHGLNSREISCQTYHQSSTASIEGGTARPTDTTTKDGQPHSDLTNDSRTNCTVKRRRLCDQLEAILDLLTQEQKLRNGPNEQGDHRRCSRTHPALKRPSSEYEPSAAEFQPTKSYQKCSSISRKKAVVNLTWSHVNMLVSKIYQGLQSMNQQSSSGQATLVRLTMDNQRLRSQLTRLHSKLSESTDIRPILRTSQSLPRTLHCSPVYSPRRQECCRSRSSRRHASVDDLQNRCARALAEVSRWRRRWKKQELELQAERQRLSMLQVDRQEDMRMRKKFLISICQLIQEASHQIDRVVQAQIEKICIGTCAPSGANRHSDGSLNHVAEFVRCSTPRIGQTDAPSPSPRGKMRLSYGSQDLVPSHSVGPSCTGDNHPIHPVNQMQQRKCELPRTPDIKLSKCTVSSEETSEQCPALMDTNCNNNIRTSYSVTAATRPPTSCPSTTSRPRLWTDDDQFSIWNCPAPRSQGSVPGSLTRDSLDGCYSPFENDRSTLQSVATTRDPYDMDSPVELEKSTTSGSPDSTLDEPSETVLTPTTEVMSCETSLFTSTSLSASNRRFILQEQWDALRVAVRHELGKVMANVVAQVKKNDSLAQDCLDAVTELQMRLTQTGQSGERPTRQSADQYCARTTPSKIALCKVRHYKHPASYRLPTASSVTGKEDNSVPLNNDNLVTQSAVQVTVAPDNQTPPATPRLQTSVMPSALPTRAPTATATSAASLSELELTVTSEPSMRLFKSSAPANLEPIVCRRSTGPKVSQPREKWKPVGGVIHTSQWRNNVPTFRTGHTRPRTPSKRKSADSAHQSLITQSSSETNSKANVCLPLVRSRRGGRAETVSATRTGKSRDFNFRSAGTRTQSEKPCVLPPLNTSISGDAALSTQVPPMSSNPQSVRRGVTATNRIRPIEEKSSVRSQGQTEMESNEKRPLNRFSGLLKRPRQVPRLQLGTIEDRILAASDAELEPIGSGSVNTNSVELMPEIQSNGHNSMQSESVPISPNEWIQIEPDCLISSHLQADSNMCCCGSSCCAALITAS